jgi:hypothetical protein
MSVGKAIRKALRAPFRPITKFIQRVGKAFRGLGNGFATFGRALGELFTEVPLGLWYFLVQIMIFIQITGEYVFTRMACGVEKIETFGDCFFYYMLDLIGKILYLVLITFPIWIIEFVSAGCIPARKVEKRVLQYFETIDRCIFDMFGFHIIHFSKSVRDKCYGCRVLKEKAFKEQGRKFNDNLKNTITPLLSDWTKTFQKGGNQIGQAFR